MRSARVLQRAAWHASGCAAGTSSVVPHLAVAPNSTELYSQPWPSTSSSIGSVCEHFEFRCYVAPAGDNGGADADVSSIGNEKVRALAEEICNLTVLEASWLSEILRKRLNLTRPALGAMPMMALAGTPPPGGASAAAVEEPEEAPKKEKTEFTVKLESFSAEGKIKVIKEIRAITGLGLKEAKELVEKAPTVVKSALPKADAEAIQKQLEGAGGKVVLE